MKQAIQPIGQSASQSISQSTSKFF